MGDAAAATVWFLGTAILLGTAVRWAQVAFPLDSRSDGVIHVIVFCWALIVVNAFVLELLGRLAPYNLIVSISAMCAAVWCWFSTSRKTDQWRVRRHRATLPTTVAQAWHSRCRRRQLLWTGAWVLFGAVAVARSLTTAATSFPSDWDSLAYHIPLVDHWIRDGTLYVPACAFWYCPGNSELLGYWLVAPFSGDFWIGLNNLPAVALLGFGVVKLLASLKVVRPVRHLAGLAIMATTVTWRQLVTSENDVAVAALFIACLWYALRVSRHRKPADLMLCAMCFGLLAGTKYLALGYAAVAGIAVVGLLFLHRHPQLLLRACCYGLIGGTVFAGYWYIRNYASTGSPLFPKGLMGSGDLWALMRPESATSSLANSGRPVVVPLLWDAVSAKCGWFHVAAFVLLPAIAASLLMAAWSTAMGGFYSRTRLWLLGVTLLANLVFIYTPNVVETAPGFLNMLYSRYHPVRLGFAAVTLMALSLAVAVSDILQMCASARAQNTYGADNAGKEDAGKSRVLAMHWLARGSVAAALAGICLQLWSHISSDVTPTLITTAIILCGTYFALARVASQPIPALLIAATALVLFAWSSQARAHLWHKDYAAYYAEHFRSEIVRRLGAAKRTSGVICVCDYKYYPFFGSRRQNDVCRPLWIPTSNSLLRYVSRQRASIVVSRRSDASAQRRYAAVPGALAEHSDVFIPLVEDSVYLCVKVDREALDAVLAEAGTP